MWKWLLIGLACFALYRLFMNDRKKKVETDKQAEEKKVASGELVKDPECGAYVDPKTSISVRNGDTVLHFCCYDCRENYLKKLKPLDEGEK